MVQCCFIILLEWPRVYTVFVGMSCVRMFAGAVQYDRNLQRKSPGPSEY